MSTRRHSSLYESTTILLEKWVKAKQSHYKPGGFQKVGDPRFKDNRHMKVLSLLALRTGYLYPQELFLCTHFCGARGGVVVKALRYKPAGRGFDSR
jgi:hypothetical protein